MTNPSDTERRLVTLANAAAKQRLEPRGHVATMLDGRAYRLIQARVTTSEAREQLWSEYCALARPKGETDK